VESGDRDVRDPTIVHVQGVEVRDRRKGTWRKRLDVVESETELGKMRKRSKGRSGHLCKVVVVEVENSEVLQAREGSRGHTADSVLAQVKLLHPDEVGEDAGAELLDEVLPQGEDGDRLQSVKRPVGHLEDLVVGQPELNEFLLLDETSVWQRYQLVVAQVDILKLSVESEGSVNCPNVVSLKLQTLDARVQRDRQHLKLGGGTGDGENLFVTFTGKRAEGGGTG